ncbi:MAG: HlyD family type I secretion periplasmic adaptor subunit [Magnetococcales bacterium]|nr:HlyD family type I secretion periplasmic adaptor subunit [Magnetococcales bacterium]MBF0435941.1 HlyD family type I secretion periplasmic adaptor subunit [Magnetococcales bacterium]
MNTAFAQLVPTPKPDGRRKKDHETAFLPAVLEILESPPHPLSRAMAATISLFFVLATTWSWFGHVDVVAVAQGKIIPNARVKIIQPLEIGVIREIHVRDGNMVQVGDLLVELDLTNATADLEKTRAELLDSEAEIVRLEALLQVVDIQDDETASDRLSGHKGSSNAKFMDDNVSDPDKLVFPKEVFAGVAALQKKLFLQQLFSFRERFESLNEEIHRKNWEQTTSQRLVKKLEDSLPLISQRTAALEYLVKEKIAAVNTYLQLEQERLETKNNLEIEKSRLEEISAGLARARRDRGGLLAEFRRDRLAELVTARTHRSTLSKELEKAERRQALTRLTAPIAGRIHDLAVHTVGGVVTPAQELMRIVPGDDTLEVEALLANKDIGFVETGQTVQIKLETFPFTQYGSIAGTVTDVSQDATMNEKLGLVFKVRADMTQSWIQVQSRRIPLMPGMAITLEAKTGERRLLEFFLTPLLRGLKESMHER